MGESYIRWEANQVYHKTFEEFQSQNLFWDQNSIGKLLNMDKNI